MEAIERRGAMNTLPAASLEDKTMEHDRLDAQRPGSRRTATLGMAAFLLLLLGAGFGWTLSGARLQAANAPTTPAAASQRPDEHVPPGRGLSYADVVAQVAPAVVTVRSERVVRASAEGPFGDDPFFQQFFGSSRGRGPAVPREEGALGSGVIVSQDGYILTNHHVIDGADHVKVDLPDRRTFDAKVVGSDAASDLAVLQISATGLPIVKMGDSEHVRVGDVVLALGNPLGVGQTVTMGIISAKGRATGQSDGSFEDFLQTDAPVNQGNSGGALVTTQGELIGINSQIISPSGGNIGIGFAIPVDMAQNVMQQLIKGGVVHRAMLGVTVQPMTSDLAKSLGLSDVRGALVSSVQPDGPGQRAGIERGDVILDVNSAPVSDGNSLRNRIASLAPGARVTLTLLRDGKRETVQPTLAELPSGRTASNEQPGGSAERRSGMNVEPVTPEIANELGLRSARGVVVDQVAAGSAASEAGVRPGDVIVQVNRRNVSSAAELEEALQASGQRPALILLNRRGSELYVALSRNA